ncbi:MAG: alpha-L-glutamate ligase [Microbacterium sp.]|uniref:ATP-grasp domain-containing protein n=1 Tax=Microbacterium sp. TaxID=51671 RepID=UPI0039E4417B
MALEYADGPAVYILHDNPEWIPPLAAALEAEGVPYREWPLVGGSFDLAQDPPEGVFWSRLSASAHTRGNARAKEHTRAVLRWLEAAGRTVVNGSDVTELEVSKVAQYVALRRAGFDVPRTIAVLGDDDLSRRARELPLPFITKHNQGGKGLGVRRFDSYEEFDAHLAAGDREEPVDGILLLQEYLPAAEPFITRAEFVGGELVYAVRVDTSAGSFELCPAEACAVPAAAPSLFARRPEITAEHPLIAGLAAFLRAHRVEVAGVEFIETADGRTVPYDINTNTNYNPDVENDGGVSAATTVARFLQRRLAETYAVAR